MTLPLERARSRRPITWLTIVGILLLPALLGGILVAALQNPTERLENMTAAIVNLDEPVTINGQYTPMGRQLASGLVEGDDSVDSNLSWVISNEDDAKEGLADGTYQAVITIPENFSAASTSAGQAVSDGGETTPEKATITVTTPEDAKVADDLITAQLASAAAQATGSALSEATTENILVGFTTIGDQIGEAADGAATLASGTKDAADGAAALPDGATQLADGATQLGSGATSLGTGATQLGSGISQLGSGATQLQTGATQLQSGATQLADGATQLQSGADQLADGIGTIADNTRNASAGVRQLASGLSTGADTITQDGIVPAELTQAAGAANDAAAAVSQQATALSTQLGDAAALCATPTDGTQQLCAAVTAAQASATTLAQTAAGAQTAAAGTDTGLGALASQAPQQIAAQLREAATGATQAADGIDQLAAATDQAKTGAQSLSTGAAQLVTGANSLADGAGQLSTGASGLATGAGQLQSGAGELASGAGQLADGADQLSDGATQLADGSSTLVTGLGQLADGSDQLASGLKDASTSLPSFSSDEQSSIASVIADPVTTTSADGDTVFGPTAIPLLAALVLWLGGLASFIALRAHTARTLTSRRSSLSLALRAFFPAGLIGAGQGLLVAVIVQIVAKYDAATWWPFAGVAVLAGVVFAAVNQALVALFGGIGRWLAALVAVLVIATGIVSTVPGWLAGIASFLPTAPALAGLVSPSGGTIAALVVWGVLSLVATTLAIAVRRTTSAKAVLALP